MVRHTLTVTEKDTIQSDLYRWARGRARKSDVPFRLHVLDIAIPNNCPVLDIPLFKGAGVSCDNSPTLDRVIPELGYVPGNIIVISNRANRMKSNGSWRELRLLVDFYEEHITQHWMVPKENPTIH